jgi:hypothetical protein
LPWGAWHTWVDSYSGVAVVTLAVLPLVALMVCALAGRRRTAGEGSSRAWRTSLADVGIGYGTLPFIWLTMLPGSGAGVVPGRVSLVPLRDLATMPTRPRCRACRARLAALVDGPPGGVGRAGTPRSDSG